MDEMYEIMDDLASPFYWLLGIPWYPCYGRFLDSRWTQYKLLEERIHKGISGKRFTNGAKISATKLMVQTFWTSNDEAEAGWSCPSAAPCCERISAGWCLKKHRLKNDGVRQWEGWHPKYMKWKIKMSETTNQSVFLRLILQKKKFEQFFQPFSQHMAVCQNLVPL